MDLGTIREKLKCLEYPDVESFVADVRLVFSNSDKYNLVITRLSLLGFKTTCSVLNLSKTATLETERSGLCREV